MTAPVVPSRTCRAAAFLAAALALPFLASAQTTPAAQSAPVRTENDTVLLPAFTVTEDSETGYTATNSVSATRVATELKKLPISIDVLTEQLFKDYGLTEIYDIVGLSSGVSSSQRAATGNNESYSIRGFVTFFSARNGNTNFRSYDSANVSRVEVVNGPASVLYGQLDPGGVANTVTKQPSAKAVSNVRLEVGSWNYFRTELGTTGPLNKSKTLTYRVDASFLDRDGYRDYDQQRKQFVAPVIRWSPRKGTSLTLDGEYVDMSLTGLSNWPRYNNRIATPPDVKFADMIPWTWNGQGPGLGTNTRNSIYTATFEHAVTDRIVIRNVAGVTSNHRNQWEAAATAINITATTPAGQLPYSRSLSGSYVDSRTFANTLNVAARFDFGRKHYTRVVAGWEYVQARSTTDSRVSGIVGGVGVATPANWDLANPATWIRDVPALADARRNGLSGLKSWEDKFYLVDALALYNERVMVLAGINRSRVKGSNYNYLTGVSSSITRSQDTPQSGVVFRITPQLGIYANYSESFRQITTALRVNADRSLTPFDPLIAKGFDYGVKYDFGDGRYSGQATVFKTININGRQSFSATDSIGAYTYETQEGENTAKGFELRLAANLSKDFQVVAGYTQTHSYISKNPANPAIIGRAAVRSPTHSATLTASYRVSKGALKGFSFGGSGSYRSEAKAFETNDAFPFLLDPRVVVNLRAGYATKVFGKPVTFGVVVNNAFSEKYFPSSISRADPASYRFTTEYRF
jgi:iron complex outermembrane receptor protein